MSERVADAITEMLSALSGESVEILELRAYGGGCINNAARVISTAGGYFVKWNSDASVQTFLDEAAGLQALRQAAGDALVVPEAIGVAGGCGGVPALLVLQHLDRLDHGDGDSTAAENTHQQAHLGTGLATIHRASATHFGRARDSEPVSVSASASTEWPQHYRDEYLLPVLGRIVQARLLSASDTELHLRLCAMLPQLLDHEPQPSLVHGDLWHGNYLPTLRGPEIVDPHAAYADRECEFGIATLFGGFGAEFWATYQRALPLAAGWQRRNRLYQLYHLLQHHFLFGGTYPAAARATAASYL